MIQSLCDPVEDLNIETVSDKNDFILSKLNDVFGDELYSISTIFKLNGIKFRENETREIAEDLLARGYIILGERYGADEIKISVKGARYIERKLKIKKSKTDKGELNEKIDKILQHLVTLGFGQEAIFNEIDELKSLQDKLSKKSLNKSTCSLVTIKFSKKTENPNLTNWDFFLLIKKAMKRTCIMN